MWFSSLLVMFLLERVRSMISVVEGMDTILYNISVLKKYAVESKYYKEIQTKIHGC